MSSIYFKITTIEDGEISPLKKFKRIEAVKYKLINGHKAWFNTRHTFFLWEVSNSQLPSLEVGDILEGELPAIEEN